ncbi:hypothetical protein GCM10027033_16790 [Leucobacter ruminantium]
MRASAASVFGSGVTRSDRFRISPYSAVETERHGWRAVRPWERIVGGRSGRPTIRVRRRTALLANVREAAYGGYSAVRRHP